MISTKSVSDSRQMSLAGIFLGGVMMVSANPDLARPVALLFISMGVVEFYYVEIRGVDSDKEGETR